MFVWETCLLCKIKLKTCQFVVTCTFMIFFISTRKVHTITSKSCLVMQYVEYLTVK